MNKKAGLFAVAALGLGLSTSANATLIDRGNGMIYDDVQDITWMADANYAATQYANSSGVEGDADGRMTWDNAMAWADNLVFGGYDDWRLVNADPSDTNCSHNFNPGGGYDQQYYGYNCTGNELGHLFYVDLGLTQGQLILSSTDEDLDLFSNVQSNYYWSGTEYAPNTSSAWSFSTYNGYQGTNGKNNEFYAWAVRSGDVAAAAVPEPGTLLLLAAGLAGVAGARRRRC